MHQATPAMKSAFDEELDAVPHAYDYGIVPGSATVFVRDRVNNVGRLDLTLLEGVLAIIDKTDQGYMVTSCSALTNTELALATASKMQIHLNKLFESMESLLMSISPMFCQRFQEVLLGKLLENPPPLTGSSSHSATLTLGHSSTEDHGQEHQHEHDQQQQNDIDAWLQHQ